MNEQTDAAREALVDALKRFGMSYTELSTRIGKNPTYIQQYLTRGSPKALPEDIRRKISIVLQMSERLLSSGPIARRLDDEGWGAPVRDLPLLGVVSGGLDRIAVTDSGVAGMIERPGPLNGVADAYAVEVIGDSQEPRLHAGDIVFINPHRAIRAGDCVVVQFDDDTACVKDFVERNEQKMVLRQYNPEKQVEVSVSSVRAIHKVVLIQPR